LVSEAPFASHGAAGEGPSPEPAEIVQGLAASAAGDLQPLGTAQPAQDRSKPAETV